MSNLDLTNRKVPRKDIAVKRPMSSIALACLCLSAFVPQADASNVKTSASLKTPLRIPVAAPVQPAVPLATAPPDAKLNCGNTPSGENKIPGWINSSAHLTSTWVGYGKLSLNWCPATVASTSDGYDPIIYTVTLNPGAYTCTTWASTSCVMSNLPVTTYHVNLLATNQTGTNVIGVPTAPNTGAIYPCVNNGVTCDVPSTTQTFETFGNAVGGLGDCTFAAAADWEQLTLGINPNPATVQEQFVNAGGSLQTGLAPSALFNYWEHSGIAVARIKSVALMGTDQLTVQTEFENIGPMLASLTLIPGQAIAGESTSGGGHMVVVDGYTPQGPVIVTWGQELQMTWQQWELEAVGLWSIDS